MARRRGIVGNDYRWRGETWRAVAQWRNAGPSGDPYSAVCTECGSILYPAVALARGFVPWCFCTGDPAEMNPGRVQHGMAPRNVLIENVATGERIVRPFQGLRRIIKATPPSRQVSALAWELRTSWAKGRKVRLVLTDRCDAFLPNADGQRVVEGVVNHVSSTDASCVLSGWLVLLAEVRTLVKPHHSLPPASEVSPAYRAELDRTPPSQALGSAVCST